MDAKSILLVLLTAGLGIVGKIVFDWLSNGRKHTTSNGSAGAQNTAFWILHYKESADRVIREVKEHLEDAEDRGMKRIDDIEDRDKRILDKVIAIEARRRTRGD